MVSTKRKSSEMVKEEPKQKKIPVLPWMRAPINVNLIEDILLEHVPGLDPRYPLSLFICHSLSLFPIVVDEIDKLLGEEYQDFLRAVLQLTRSDEEHQFSHMRASQSLFGPLRTIRRSGNERGFKGKFFPRLVKMILSATLTQSPGKLSKLDLHHPLFLTTGRYQLPDKLQLLKLTCEVKSRPLYLAALLHEQKEEQSTVFAKSKDSTHELCTMLNCFDLPFKIKEYSAFQPQSLQSRTLEKFREGKIQVLIAADAMTRGMDVAGVRHVINYAMPFHVRTYIHRAGRTTRAGNSGRCFTFLARNQVV
ncbi:hypothetical protein MKW98_015268 [Papaver atlanticum]|uniref:ATP-dependent RNA helicase n=1 Tax=Papaver atlanticum TaxID=357466 RepID=A0AAD4XQV3_9MAGN|nr:hypothetical protein MKW98_015268 [Papaver atlanticum]